MIHRTTTHLGSALLLALAAACAPPASAQVDGARQALLDAARDVDIPEENATVLLTDARGNRCTGTRVAGAMPALVSWRSEARGDNFITADPGWTRETGGDRSLDYRFVRAEGFLYPAR